MLYAGVLLAGGYAEMAGLGQTRAALAWEHYLRKVTARKAGQHLSSLRKLEKAYAMRLPSVRDRLNERFVKPLAVNRMVAPGTTLPWASSACTTSRMESPTATVRTAGLMRRRRTRGWPVCA